MEISARARRALLVALVSYSTLLAIALLAPTSQDQSAGASWLVDLATTFGFSPETATQGRAEFVANALILMPVSALGSLLWPSTNWRDWTAYAFVIAGSVELTQGLLLPARTASMADVAANTLGGLGGAAFIGVVRWAISRRRRAAGTPPTTPEG